MARRLLKMGVVVCVTLSLSGCAWFWKEPLTGAYGDGFHRGCQAKEHGSGYEARDADARAHLQGHYWEGWGRGFIPASHHGRKSSRTNGSMAMRRNTAASIKKSVANAKTERGLRLDRHWFRYPRLPNLVGSRQAEVRERNGKCSLISDAQDE